MLRARVITALLLAAGLLAVLFLLPARHAELVFGLIAALAAWEWAGLMRIDGAGRIMFAAVAAMFCWQVKVGGEPASLLFMGAATLFWLLVAGLWLRRRWPLAGNDFLGYGLGLLLLVATWTAMTELHGRSPWLLLGVMSLAWVADTAAYFTGRAYGSHKLAPNVSPGKTWEGVAGGAAAVLVWGLGLAAATGYPGASSPLQWVALALVLVLLTALSVVGDLFESLLKRQAGIKDSSALLPGHGGILDRIDSLTALLPVATLVLKWSGR